MNLLGESKERESAPNQLYLPISPPRPHKGFHAFSWNTVFSFVPNAPEHGTGPSLLNGDSQEVVSGLQQLQL